MPIDIGFDFRATSGFVTDGAGRTYCLAVDLYPVTRAGFTFGWEVSSGGQIDSRDRQAGNIPELAGMNFSLLTSVPAFRLDLPSAGSYDIRIALGDPDNPFGVNWTLQDGATVLDTYSGSTSAAQRFIDAVGAEYTNLTWAASNTPITRSFSSTTLRLKSNSALAVNAIAFLGVVTTPTGVVSAPYYYRNQVAGGGV